VRLGPGPEFDLIRSLVDAVRAPVPLSVPLGDDAAALRVPPEHELVVSTDLSLEGVHFGREWTTWEVVGYRAVAAALSDLAAMAATPIGVLVSVAIPPELGEEILVSLGRGMGECLRLHGGGLLGGDTSRSPDPVLVDVTALGYARRTIRRDGARVDDELWVTGTLGAAAAAVADLSRGLEPDLAARQAFERPVPRLREASWLVEKAELHAMIDLSDGLAGDAAHLASACSLCMEIELETVPIAPPLRAYPEAELARRLALSGGEDYELLLAAPPGALERLRADFERTFDVALTRIGRVREGHGVRWLQPDGETATLRLGGWDHFAKGSPP
jgi:thiamine-monophosphate kinase